MKHTPKNHDDDSKPVPPDLEIIEGIRGDGLQRERSETDLYNKYKGMVSTGYIYKSPSEEHSIMAYSDAIIAAIKNIRDRTYNQTGTLESYIRGIFSHKCCDELRREWKFIQKNHMNESIDKYLNMMTPATADIIRPLMEKQQKEVVYQKLKRFSKKYFRILSLWNDNYSDEEIAKILRYRNARVARVTRVRCLTRFLSYLNTNHYE